MHHSFLKIWYDGTGYHGSQYQPGLPTVDGALVAALQDIGYIPRGESHVNYFKVAGRTDKGVSALGAVYYIAALRPLHPPEINHALRGGGHSIEAWAVARLDNPRNPRDAIARVYKYIHVSPGNVLDVGNIARGLEVLQGEHEFKGFTKATIPSGTRTVRTLDVAALEVDGDALIFTFQSKGFLWEQVRRMISFLLEHHDDPELVARIELVLATGKQPNVEPAHPGGLVLWDVCYDHLSWESVDGSAGLFTKAASKRCATHQVQSRISSMILDAATSWEKNEET